MLYSFFGFAIRYILYNTTNSATHEPEGVNLKIDKNAGVLPDGISISGVGTVHISAQDQDTPTRAQMWETIQQQQQEVETLKGILKKNHQDVGSLKMSQGENQLALAKTKKDLDEVNLKLDSGKNILPQGIKIGGAVEIEAGYSEDYSGVESNDLTLATVELSFETKLNNWVNTSFALLYEDDPGQINVDEAIVTIGNSERSQFYVTTGLTAAPFGSFETQLLSDPLTLSMGESGGNVLVLLGVENNGFSGSLYAFNGDTNETGQKDVIAHGGVSVGYSLETEDFNFSLGAGYINNIADTDGITDVLTDAGGLKDTIAGYTVNGMLAAKGFTLIGEYVTAGKAFQNSELAFNGKGAKPSAWLLEVGYTFEVAEREATIAANIQGTREALALGLPKSRIAVGSSIAMFENTTVGFEWAHDKDYSTSDTGADNTAGSAATNKDADSATMKLAVEF
ncbi:MAG: LbtU family siderophore porin [Magnetococcales bacterium]|nr:LbtU family siderophore porin [Magnetococcales bacterium]